MHAAVDWGTLVCLGYMLAVFAPSALVLIVSGLDNVIRSRETLAENFGVLGRSRFTPPVSALVPAYNEEGMVLTAVQSVLAFDYPEFEVIIVDDGSTDRTFEALERELDLEPFGYYERGIVECAPVKGVYRSRRHEDVKVVRKENQGTKADASNSASTTRATATSCCSTATRCTSRTRSSTACGSSRAIRAGYRHHGAHLRGLAARDDHRPASEDRELIDGTLLSNFQHSSICVRSSTRGSAGAGSAS